MTARATVRYESAKANPDALADAIRGAGYEVLRASAPVSLRVDAGARAEAPAQAEAHEQRTMRRDFIVAAALSVPLLVVAMSHGAIPHG